MQDPTIWWLQEINFKYKNTDVLKCKRWKRNKTYKTLINRQKAKAHINIRQSSLYDKNCHLRL